MTTYEQKLGHRVNSFNRGQFSPEYSVGSRLAAGAYVSPEDMRDVAKLLQDSGIRGSKTVAKDLLHLARHRERQATLARRHAFKAVEHSLLESDESHLWPIRNRFNVTKRAIGRVKRLIRAGLVVDSPDDYETIIEAEISEIVNNLQNR